MVLPVSHHRCYLQSLEMDWMTVSGYRLPQQIPGQAMSQQQQQEGNGVISKTELNRSDSTIGISSETAATSTPVQQQQLGIMASLSGNGGGGLNRSTSISDPTHHRLSASSSNSSSSSAMIDMWVAANAAIKVEASSQQSNQSISGPLIGDGSISPPTGISTPGSIKGKEICYFHYYIQRILNGKSRKWII